MSAGRHVCDERATREKFNLVGSDKPLPTTHGIAWCGEHYVGWAFNDASHALLSLRYTGSVAPCLPCLRALRDVIDRELAEAFPASGAV